MKHDWRSAIRRLIFSLALAFVVGWLFNKLTLAIMLTLAVYLTWHLHQLYKLQQWLTSRGADEPPTSHGLWGSIFDDVYRLQHRHQKSKNKLKAMLKRVQDSTSALKDGVLMVDSHGNLEWWNQAANALLGLQNSKDIGQPITNLVRNPDFKAYFEKAHYESPLEMASPINHDAVLQFHITLFGRKDRLIVCRDISHLHQLEAMRQDFVANASHELRTPLTVISGYLETFIEYKETLPARWGRALTQMHEQSQRMQNLINDLLVLSRLETSNAPDQTQVNIPNLLSALVADAKSLSGDKQHNILLECEDVSLIGTDTELSSAFGNLIFNAVKYTPASGEINVKWWQDTTGLHLEVKDNGLGIDHKHIPRLTERFYRADPSRHSDTGGTGLGLAIVKHTLLRHDGHLHISSVLGKGSCFTCHFPASRKVTNAKVING
ncbi:phosphate regulon sensor histidine kinase PhoR [Oceaniserpentilla sp. 4NH20-0058]|uniref:phosphate regulon sensor histidine kinase PhoR n=1 Tax=Oceaniserpentilla sp. 4NH20-0058 TaxID=3127660 RepID=UPI003107A5DC